MKDIYQKVTDKIISQLETGSPPWIKPWKNARSDGFSPYNAATGRPYHGINVLVLWSSRYDNQGWLTYKNARSLGGYVRKGEHGEQIVFWQFNEVEDKKTGEKKTIPFARAYTVFNVEQCDGLKLPKLPDPPKHENGIVDAIALENGAEVRHTGNRAFFSPKEDYIAIPRSGQFDTSEDYESTLAHELTHWTGHKDRLDRNQKNRFGSESYAFEELVAEMGSAFLSSHIGIEPKLAHHGAYLESWLRVLRSDNRAIFTAANMAQSATDYLMNRQGLKRAA